MAQQDRIHPQVRQALIHDGWVVHEQIAIRYDPSWSGTADLLAHAALTATQGERVIVVEVKSFRPRFTLTEVEKAVGQYLVYKSWLARRHPTWELYLAVSTTAARFFAEEALQVVIQDYGINLLVVDVQRERIVTWTR